MYQVLAVIWAITLVVTLLGCIPYFIWVLRTAVKKQWRRVGRQVGIPLAGYAFLFGLSAIASVYARKHYFTDLFDAKGDLGPTIYVYDSPRAFNGDGYSLSVYELPLPVRARFLSPDVRLLSEFPKRPGERSHWSEEPWRAAPFDARFKPYLDFALTSYDARREPGLAEQFTKIREILSRSGSYYAFFYYSHGGYPGNIDFFLINLPENRLYIINHNT